MLFLYFLIVLFILLIFTTIVSSLLSFVLKLVTRVKYEQLLLILPSFLIIILWFLLGAILVILLNNVFNIDILKLILNSIWHINNNLINVTTLLLIFAVMAILTIVIQSFILLCVNIDYSKIEYFIRNIFKMKIVENNEENQLVYDDIKKLKYVNALISSLFLFSVIFFLCIVLYVTGVIISSKII